MGTEYYVACHDCKQYTDIGKGWGVESQLLHNVTDANQASDILHLRLAAFDPKEFWEDTPEAYAAALQEPLTFYAGHRNHKTEFFSEHHPSWESLHCTCPDANFPFEPAEDDAGNPIVFRQDEETRGGTTYITKTLWGTKRTYHIAGEDCSTRYTRVTGTARIVL